MQKSQKKKQLKNSPKDYQAILKFISENQMASAIIVAILTFAFTLFVKLCNFVFWYHYFISYNISFHFLPSIKETFVALNDVYIIKNLFYSLVFSCLIIIFYLILKKCLDENFAKGIIYISLAAFLFVICCSLLLFNVDTTIIILFILLFLLALGIFLLASNFTTLISNIINHKSYFKCILAITFSLLCILIFVYFSGQLYSKTKIGEKNKVSVNGQIYNIILYLDDNKCLASTNENASDSYTSFQIIDLSDENTDYIIKFY